MTENKCSECGWGGGGIRDEGCLISFCPRHVPTAAQTVGWRCFHCDEVFTDPKAAANHFGVDHVGDETLCQMAQVDGGIAKVIADLAEELQRYRSEDNTSYREFYALGADHRAALIREEQKGYDRGLADARAEACSDSSTDRHPLADQYDAQAVVTSNQREGK